MDHMFAAQTVCTEAAALWRKLQSVSHQLMTPEQLRIPSMALIQCDILFT